MTRMQIYALSIAGPFARWIASGETIEPLGAKSIELRSWQIRHRNIMVLLHCSQNREYDHHFALMPFSKADCPKSSIVGAAILTGMQLYSSEELWERDRRKHCWMGNESFEFIYREYYGGTPYGHVLVEPILFPEPILDVPGDRGYWQPNPKKPVQEVKQKRAFSQAIALIKQIRIKK